MRKRKIAILGGGITGLTAAYYLSKKNYSVVLFEREKILGGMASGFKKADWEWYLDRTIHHLFTNDYDFLLFAKEIGFSKILFKTPQTASFYNSRIFSVDSPQELLKMPELNLIDKIKVGATLLFLKLSPKLSFYEKTTSVSFLKQAMGERGYRVLFQQLFRKKFGKYAENILSSFIWARIKKRTKKLGYPYGGFQSFINFLQEICVKNAVIIKNRAVENIERREEKFFINGEFFDIAISTLPTPIFLTVAKNIIPKGYYHKLSQIKYLHALSLILETKEPILKDVYWLNISDEKNPLMGVFAHTNFMDKKFYNNHHTTYVGWYLEESDEKWLMTKEELVDWIVPYLNQVGHFNKKDLIDSFLFRAKYAQPIFDKEFLMNKPDFITPIKNLFIANLDMTYPYDRGTNYAVMLGKKISGLIK